MIKNYIYLILFLICLSCIYNYYNTIEHMSQDKSHKNIINLDKPINTDWSKYWNVMDHKARKNEDCNPISKDYTKLGTIDTWIWVMPTNCENGMPHTRGIDIIAMPENFSKTLMAKTLEHEKIHLLQKRNPDKWKQFYSKYWNYEIYHVPPSGMPKELIEMKRANPDTAEEPYNCWKNNWWAIPVYKSVDNLNFRSSPVLWWDQSIDQIYNHPPKEWVDFFGTHVAQAEHPHEISAVYIANWLFNKDNIQKTEALKRLVKKYDFKLEKLKHLV